MELQRLTSPKICFQQAEDPGEPTVYFQSKSKGLKTRKANDTVPV